MRKSEILRGSFLSIVEARSITALCCSRRACSLGVKACCGVGDAGTLVGGCDVESRWRLSIAGKEAVVLEWVLGAVTVTCSGLLSVGLAAKASFEVSCPPNERVETL